MGKIRIVPVALTAVVSIFALTGCVSATPTPSPSSVPPSASAPAELSSTPTSRFDLKCAGLVTTDELETIFGPNDYQPRANWLPSVSPVKYAVQTIGGLSCTWGNDDVPVDGVPNPAYQELTVQVLPDASAAQIERHTGDHPLNDSPAFGDSSGTKCVGMFRLCTSNIIVGEAWVDVFLEGMAVSEPISDADTLTIAAGVTRCIVGPATGSEVVLADLELLPHGAWAFAPAEVQRGVWDTHEEVRVAGVTEKSYLVCPIGAVSACSVDFVVGDDWVRLGTPIDGQHPASQTDRTNILELAGHVASALI